MMSTTQPQLLTRVELAKHFDISIDRVQQYVSLGLPVHTKGKQGKAALYDLQACEQWVQENFRQEETGTLQEAKLRKLTAEAALAEIELERERGRLVEIDEVAKQVTAMLTNVRAKLLALPTKTSGLCLGLTSQAQIKEVIDNAVREALDELSGAEFITGQDSKTK